MIPQLIDIVGEIVYAARKPSYVYEGDKGDQYWQRDGDDVDQYGNDLKVKGCIHRVSHGEVFKQS